MANKDQGVKVDLTGGLLTITIGVSQICKSVLAGSVLEDFEGGEEAKITDEDAFARMIASKLLDEDEAEGGGTMIHGVLDRAARKAIEDGCEGVRFPGDA